MNFIVFLSLPIGVRCGSSFKQCEFPSLNDAMCYVWLNLVQYMLLEKKIFKYGLSCFFSFELFSYDLSFEKKSSLPMNASCQLQFTFA